MQEKFKQNKSVVGPFLKIASPEIVEIMGNAGFDYVIIDCEHGPLSLYQAQDMVRAAEAVGISSVIRVAANDPVMIARALDVGANAVQIPQVSTKEAAQSAATAAKYAPMGERGLCPSVRASKYTHILTQDYLKKANEETMVIIHIEGAEGVKNIDEILTVEGIDVIFLGPYDLSQSLGLSGQADHPKVVEMMESVVEKAKAQGKIVGTYVDHVETGRKWMEAGVQYISYRVDTGIIYKACKDIADQFK